MNLKPVMCQDVRRLEPNEVRVEEIRRNSLLKEVNRRNSSYEMKNAVSLFRCVPDCCCGFLPNYLLCLFILELNMDNDTDSVSKPQLSSSGLSFDYVLNL